MLRTSCSAADLRTLHCLGPDARRTRGPRDHRPRALRPPRLPARGLAPAAQGRPGLPLGAPHAALLGAGAPRGHRRRLASAPPLHQRAALPVRAGGGGGQRRARRAHDHQHGPTGAPAPSGDREPALLAPRPAFAQGRGRPHRGRPAGRARAEGRRGRVRLRRLLRSAAPDRGDRTAPRPSALGLAAPLRLDEPHRLGGRSELPGPRRHGRRDAPARRPGALRLLRGARRAAARGAAGGPRERARQRAHRGRAALPRGAPGLLPDPRRRRERDHAQRDQRGTPRLPRPPRRVGAPAPRARAPPARGGGDPALDEPRRADGAHRGGGRRDRRPAHPRRRAPRALLRLGEPRRGGLRGAGALRRRAPPEPPPRVRRGRALLPRGAPGAHGGAGRLPPPRAAARARRARGRARAPPLEHGWRDQGASHLLRVRHVGAETMGHEIAVRGGTLVDGSGAPARRADVGISGGRITEIGPRVTGAREIDASGRLVAPGFIDLHTHYDPQVLWDPQLTPSSWHGVTSVVAGNCGYSLAPTRAADRPSLLRTLDKVEDMRVETLEAGVAWDFETYPEYLDAVRRRGIAIHFGGYVGHTAVRLYVLGDAAYERPASDAEIARMKRVVADSLRGGALGFSSDRAGFHLADGGRPAPSIAATQAETEALCGVTAEVGRGVVSVAAGEEYGWSYALQRRIGRRVDWASILTYPKEVKRASWREKLAAHLAGRRAGADVAVQVSCRPIEQELLLAEPTAFYVMPAFKELVALPHAERSRLWEDRGWRARVQKDLDENGLLNSRWHTIRVLESPSHPECVGRSVGAIADARGVTPFDAISDLAVDDGPRTRRSVGFAYDEVEGVKDLHPAERWRPRLSDAGAHVSQICDAIMPTDFLAHWVRDRGLMPLERGIRKLTGELAEVLELDRGRIEVGAPGDVVVLDYERLDPGPIRRVCDMPARGERLVADAPVGIECALVNGVPIRLEGRPVVDGLERLPGTILTNAPAA